jgi:polyphenol oxidase
VSILYLKFAIVASRQEIWIVWRKLGIMWLNAPNLQSNHGFSTRTGGSSTGNYEGLNLSERVGDDPNQVLENRVRALNALGLGLESVARLNQIHSSIVVKAIPGLVLEGDALITNNAKVALVIETADCYPVLLEDRINGVIGAAHCGWRGTVGKILENTLRKMLKLGAKLEHVRAAIGPGICFEHYAVGLEVQEQFLNAGFPASIFEAQDQLWKLNLSAANAWLLESCGMPKNQIWQSKACSTDPDFFSYRRDAGKTGRMWSIIANQVKS